MSAEPAMKLRYNTTWIRDHRNPVLPPTVPEFDSAVCMNPWATRDGDTYTLYYAGSGADGRRRICTATADTSDPSTWNRRGPLFELGEHGEFDGAWCVLPHAVDVDETTKRVYYTGNSGIGKSLDRFPGLGYAESHDKGETFTKSAQNPVIRPSGRDGDPDAKGIAGGSVVRVTAADGTEEWRFYYTGCPTLGEDIFLDQQKVVCLATSTDGITWEKKGAILRRNPDCDYENIAVAGPVVRQHADGTFQMWYSAIGTRWGFYSICYAESEDGYHWRRGTHYGDNLQLGPKFGTPENWESQMVQYPSIVESPNGTLRLFYTGNGYGRTGIGTASAVPLRATHDDQSAHITHLPSGKAWSMRWDLIDGIGSVEWQGPNPDGTIWWEKACSDALHARFIVSHTETGLNLRLTLINTGTTSLRGVRAEITLTPAGLALDWPTELAILAPGATETMQGTISL